MNNQLQLTVAKLELKQLELVEKLSERHNDYVIRLIQSSITDKFIAVNGDWELLTGIMESNCIGKSWENIIPKNEVQSVIKHINTIKKDTQYFDGFNSTLYKRDGDLISVSWKGKYFPEINGLVFIGRVTRG
jgi:PAS domain S-box-containing protein